MVPSSRKEPDSPHWHIGVTGPRQETPQLKNHEPTLVFIRVNPRSSAAELSFATVSQTRTALKLAPPLGKWVRLCECPRQCPSARRISLARFGRVPAPVISQFFVIKQEGSL